MKRQTIRKPELLVPASCIEVLQVAVMFGADAVYIGGESFGLRAKAKNFTEEEMALGIAFAHRAGAKVYVAANILAHNADIEEAAVYFRTLKKMKPDAIIIADPGMVLCARKECPEIPLHLSTQANNTNYLTYQFWYDQGIKRVVAARELSLLELEQIRSQIPADMEIETFVHGAMCISYAGRCLLSNYLADRDANQGACTHPCRWKYALMEESRPGEYLPVYENERGTYIFNSKDLCMIAHVPALVRVGIDSFKIEGRMKNALYAATVTRTYRKAIDAYMESEACYMDLLPWCLEEITKCTYRRFTTGFYLGKPNADAQIYDHNTYVNAYVYLGIVEGVLQEQSGAETTRQIECKETPAQKKGSECAVSTVRIVQKNKFSVGEDIEIMKPSGKNTAATVLSMQTEDGLEVESCPHPGQVLYVTLSAQAQSYDVLRKSVADAQSK